MSDLSTRCEYTLDYRSRGYVEDARDYARWILRLKDATPTQRRTMLAELGANVPRSVEDELSAWRVEFVEATHGNIDPSLVDLFSRLVDVIAELRVQLGNVHEGNHSVGSLPK